MKGSGIILSFSLGNPWDTLEAFLPSSRTPLNPLKIFLSSIAFLFIFFISVKTPKFQ